MVELFKRPRPEEIGAISERVASTNKAPPVRELKPLEGSLLFERFKDSLDSARRQGHVSLWRGFLITARADAMLEKHLAGIDFESGRINAGGKWRPISRLTPVELVNAYQTVHGALSAIHLRTIETLNALHARGGHPLSIKPMDQPKQAEMGTWAERLAKRGEPEIDRVLSFTHAYRLNALARMAGEIDVGLTKQAATVEPRVLFKELFRRQGKEPDLLSFSEPINRLIGLRHEPVEELIQKDWVRARQPEPGSQLFEGTPYETAFQFLHALKLTKHDVLYDIGSGHGHVVFAASLATPIHKAVGIELNKRRVDNCNALVRKHGLDNIEFRHGDALEQDLSDGTVFFFYPTVEGKLLEKIWPKLKALDKPIRLVVRGSSEPYFSSVPELERVPSPGAPPNIRIYGFDPRRLTSH